MTPVLTPELSGADVATFATLKDDQARGRFLSAHPSLVHAAVVEQLTERVREHVRVDVGEAGAMADAAVLIAGRLNDDTALGRAVRAKANACWFANDLKSATALFDEAARLFETEGAQAELGRTLSSSIQSHILLGEYPRAMEAAERARRIFEAHGDEHRLARLDINVANILHRQDRLSEALAAYERAYERLLPHHDGEAIGVVLHNLAVVLIVLNDFDRALSTYERAREHCLAAGMPRLVAQADYNIAYLYFFRGDYSRALELLRTARLACQKVGDPYHSALCNLDQSEIYLELNLIGEAAEMAHEAQVEFERLGNGYEAARALTNFAIAVSQQGEAFRALELFTEARARFEREQNASWPSVIDLYQALVLNNAGRHFEAKRLCLSALAFFVERHDRRKAILCEMLLARIELQTGAYAAALDHCGHAIAEIERLEAPVLDYQAYFLRGQIQEAAKEREGAYASYGIARERLEAHRSILWGEDLKIAFMREKVAVYERLIDLRLERAGDAPVADEIFGYIEQAKSRSLRDLFSERAVFTAAPPSGQSDLVRQIRTLREELNWYYHRVELEQLNRTDVSGAHLGQLEEQLRSRENEFVRILREMPQGARESAGLHDTAPAGPDEIRTALGPDTTLIEYFRMGDRIIAAVLTATRLDIVPLTTASKVDRLVRLLLFQLAKFQYGPEYVAKAGPALLTATNAHLRELHEELVAPLTLDGSHAVIIPHDLLHYVPFHALFDGQRYLCDAMPVSYAPSATVYAMCCRREAVPRGGSLILGVPDERAPFIEDEVTAVAKTLPGADLRLGSNAGAGALNDLAAGTRYLHIATHGSFREDNPLFSGLRLADSYLTVQDLYELRLPVELITLSGCGTGLNTVTAGDELRGLVRGLLAAGTRSALVTLWDVHDRSTATLMAAFYERLNAGADKGRALRDAMAGLRETFPHPYYWAPFVLVGAHRSEN